MTCEELAVNCGITPTHLWRIETGKIKQPFPKTLKALSDYLKLDFNELIGAKKKKGTLAQIIRNARVCKGYTEQEVATMAKLSLTTISNIEIGKTKRPAVVTLSKLMEVLEIDSEDLAEVCDYINTSTLASLVKNSRLRKRLTQQEVAGKCGISITYLSNIETGNIFKIKPKILKKLSIMLDLDFAKLTKSCGWKKID